MATNEIEPRFMSFQEYISWRAWRGLSDDEQAPPYAHPVDGWILKTLESAPVKNILDRGIDTYISVFMGRFLAQGIPLDGKSFPEIYDLLTECARTLGIAIPHALTGSSGYGFNAFTAGTDDYAYIFITDSLMKYFSPQEAQFVIGHECGHIASRHLVYHTLVDALSSTALGFLGPLGRLIQKFAGIGLYAWARRSEITADRAGLICCGDLMTAQRSLLRLVAGLSDPDKIDLDDYLRRFHDLSDFHGASSWQEMFSTHPMIPKRIEALSLFARSELYYDLTGLTPADGQDLLTQQELDRLTNEIVRP